MNDDPLTNEQRERVIDVLGSVGIPERLPVTLEGETFPSQLPRRWAKDVLVGRGAMVAALNRLGYAVISPEEEYQATWTGEGKSEPVVFDPPQDWQPIVNAPGEFVADEEATGPYDVSSVGRILREAADFVDKTEHFMGPNSVDAVTVFRRFDGSWGWHVSADDLDYDDDEP